MSLRKPRRAKHPAQEELPLPPPGETPGLGQLVDWYLRKHVVHKRPLTQKSMKSTFRSLTAQFGPLARLMPGDVRDWLSGRLTRNEILPGTANLVLAHIHHMYEVARQERWPLLLNAGAGKRFDKAPEAPKALREPDTTWPRLLAAMPDDAWRAFLCVQRNLGLRKAEACGLEPKHVRLNAPGGPELRVEQQRHAKLCSVSLKMYARPRTQKLDKETLGYLRAVLKDRLKEGPGRGQIAQYLFPWTDEQLNPMVDVLREVSPEDFPKRVNGVQAGAGYHVLRHTYAHDLAKAGFEDRDIMVLMGHASILSTSCYMQSIREGKAPDAVQQKLLAYMEQRQGQQKEAGQSVDIKSARTRNTRDDVVDAVSSRRKS